MLGVSLGTPASVSVRVVQGFLSPEVAVGRKARWRRRVSKPSQVPARTGRDCGERPPAATGRPWGIASDAKRAESAIPLTVLPQVTQAWGTFSMLSLSLFTSRQRTRLCSAFICPLFTHRGQYPGPVCLPVALASWKPPDRLSPSAPRLHAAASLTELLHPVLDCCLPSSSQPGRAPHTLTPWWCALQSHSADAGLESHTALLSTAGTKETESFGTISRASC